MALKAYQFRNIDPAFIQEVATGLEEPAQIADRYGYTPDQWEAISHHKGFINEVNRIRAEMEKSGQTFRLKAAVMADTLLDNTYQSALSPDVPVKDKAAALQVLAKFADLEPKRDSQASTGPAFSISINIPGGIPTVENVVVEAKAAEEKPEDANLSLDFGGSDA